MVGAAMARGIDDALEITRECMRLLADDRRTQTVTRKNLDDALDELDRFAARRSHDAGRRCRAVGGARA